MEYRPLGRTGIEVSALCLGTMTWGEQNSEAEGHAQMDRALERGVTFFDTAEMYAVPPRPETYGRTEEIIGTWFKQGGKRDGVVLGSKIAGPGRRTWIRDGQSRFDRTNLRAAVETSLKRLQTDYIDFYQLHWPDRPIQVFGKLGYDHVEDAPETVQPEETLEALQELVTEGKIRAVGLSNETAWGTMRFLAAADAGHGPRMAAVQNPYSLLNRSFETGLAEIAIREDCGLLAYAPLGAGTLTGKYLDGAKPEGARLTLFPENRRYQGPRAEAAIVAYVGLARAHGLDPAQMALAFVRGRPFVTAAIIGATNLDQLETNLASAEVTLSAELLEALEGLHKDYTYPCP